MATGFRPFATFSPQVSGCSGQRLAGDRGAAAAARPSVLGRFAAVFSQRRSRLERYLRVGLYPNFTCACTQGNLIIVGPRVVILPRT